MAELMYGGPAILPSFLQFAAFLAIVVHLCSARAGFQRRNARSWGAILKRLRGGAGAALESSAIAAKSEDRSTAEAIAQRVHGRRGRRMMFHRAGAMMEMADYAERNGGQAIDPLVNEDLSGNHAAAIRIATAKDFFPFRQVK